MSGSARKSGDAQTAQVVTLLNQLGDRMVRGEHERLAVREEIENTREMLSDLENRADMAERVFLTIQDNISKKESAAEGLIERQNRLEKMYQDSAERLKRAEALTSQIEEAIALQNSLARRLEKTAQDKVRMMNKIEHLEAAVEETRQSLNSGALVGIKVPQPPANDAANHTGQAAAQGPWWKAPYQKQAAVFASLAIAGLLCGVALSQLITHWPQAKTPVVASVAAPTEMMQATSLTPEPQTPQIAAADATISTTAGDLAPYSEDTLTDAMDMDPDALAATLNDIEPGLSDAGVETQAMIASMPEVAQTAPATTITAPPAANPEIDAFLKGERPNTLLSDRIQTDAALPAVIQKIEAKAFEGIPEAQHDLAAIYTAGHGGVSVDYNRAALWFREAAVNGVANARYNLGVLYHQGLGVDRDVSKALGWYRAAAHLGHPEAQYNLGIAAIEGIGTAYNPRQAADYFESAARGGVMEAAYNLGLIHENGLLGDADMNEAIFWYSTASDHNPEARVALNQIIKGLGLKKPDVDRVVKEYGALYKLNEPSAAVKKASFAAPVTETTKVAGLAPQDEAASHDPAALAKIIPPLSADDSRALLNSLKKEPTSKHALIAQVQEQLIKSSLYPGPADGVGGPQTDDAIRTYQARNNLDVTGKASEKLLKHMLSGDTGNVGLAAR